MTPLADRCRIAAILGTSRPGNYAGKALAVALNALRSEPDVHVDVFDPADADLGFPGAPAGRSVEGLQRLIGDAAGVLIATPEYHGSFSAMLKLLIENLGFPSRLSGKPVALLGVAAGRIGAIKSLEHLRSVCSHVGAIVLPGPVSIANVQDVFDEDGACSDPQVERQIQGLAAALLDYVRSARCPERPLEKAVREG